MAGLVVGRPDRFAILRLGSAESGLDEPLVDVAGFPVPESCLVRVLRIVAQKVGVVFQMRTAPGRVRDDGVERFQIEAVDRRARLCPGLLEIAVVSVKRAAAALRPRRYDFATVREEDVD